jgi:hypothetical protein
MRIQKEELGDTGKVILRPVQALGVANSWRRQEGKDDSKNF